VEHDQKLILWRGGQRQLFDVGLDPHEQTPGEIDEGERLRLERRLETLRARAERNRVTPEQRVPDARTREALEALGYLE
jgi:hypothetical protein